MNMSGMRILFPIGLVLVLAGVLWTVRQGRTNGDEDPEAPRPTPRSTRVAPAQEDLAKKLKKEVAALAEEARTLRAKGDLEGAAKVYRQVLDLDAAHEEALQALAELEAEVRALAVQQEADRLFEEKNWLAAEAAYERLLAEHDTEKLRERIRRCRYERAVADGEAAEARGDLKAALVLYRAAMDFFETDQIKRRISDIGEVVVERELAARSADAEGLMEEARALELDGKYAEAEELYERCAEVAPDPTLAQTRLEACRRKRVESEHLYGTALQEGRAAMEEGAWHDAITAAQRALTFRPADRDAAELLTSAQRRAILEGMVLIPEEEVTVDGQDGTAARKVLPAFYVDRHEVTHAQYHAFVKATGQAPPRSWPNGGLPQGLENYPVTGVSATDADAFARWAGKRLPTVAEWLRACGWDGGDYPWGAEFQNEGANCLEAAVGGPAPVGAHPLDVSRHGLLDVFGNAMEWTADSEEVSLPGPDGQPKARACRILIGGSFLFPGQRTTLGRRSLENPALRRADAGFRCAVEAGP